MSIYTDQYTDLLIKQFFEKPNAFREIALLASTFESTKDFIESIVDKMDVDIAVGDQLDKVGDIVGIERSEPEFDDDEIYRFFIKLKISVNISTAFMVSSEKGTGIQDSVFVAFSGLAYVTDKKNMSIDLYIDDTFPINIISIILRLNLIPKPQGVRIGNVIQVSDEPFFGFRNNETVKGFANKFDPSYVGGMLANKVVF